VYAPAEDKRNYEELQQVIDRLPVNNIIMLRGFNAILGRGFLYTPTFGNDS
jgi:hypothetical protein